MKFFEALQKEFDFGALGKGSFISNLVDDPLKQLKKEHTNVLKRSLKSRKKIVPQPEFQTPTYRIIQLKKDIKNFKQQIQSLENKITSAEFDIKRYKEKIRPDREERKQKIEKASGELHTKYKEFYDRYEKIKANVESDAFHKKVVNILSNIGFHTTLIKIENNFNPVISKLDGTIRKDNKYVPAIMMRIHFELPTNSYEFKTVMNSIATDNRTPTFINKAFNLAIKEKVEGITSVFLKQLNLDILGDTIDTKAHYANKTSPVTGVLTLAI